MVLLIEDFFSNLQKYSEHLSPFSCQLAQDRRSKPSTISCLRFSNSPFVFDQVFFEILKMKIRSVSITYSIRKSRDEKEKTLKLENDIQILENQTNLNPTEFIQASLNQKKGELENRRQDIVGGLLLRSRANWHTNGERCSEYFCKLEKKVLYQQNHF